jgi:hypothetical protein
MIETVYRGLFARKLCLQGCLKIKSGAKHFYKLNQRGLGAKRSEKGLKQNYPG